jgi:AraC family transcriptional regulator
MQENLVPEVLGGADATTAPQTRTIQQQQIARVLEYIHANLHHPLDREQLARVAHLSESHLNVVFRGQVGESLYQHVRRLRLERAAVYLRYSDRSVLDIALACGFATHEAFSRAFREAFGCTPRAFRQRPKSCDLPTPNGMHFREKLPIEFIPIPDEGKSLNVRIVELPAIHLACSRFHGSYTQAHWAWPPLLWWAWRTRRLNAQTVFFGLSYDDESITPEEHQRYDAAIVVEEDFAGDDTIQSRTIEAGLFAVTTVKGSFADYWRIAEAFYYQWLPQSGYSLRALYGLDRYHVPGNILNPLTLIETVRCDFHVDVHIPIGRGPFGRTLPT